jgi:hypothetical protein
MDFSIIRTYVKNSNSSNKKHINLRDQETLISKMSVEDKSLEGKKLFKILKKHSDSDM